MVDAKEARINATFAPTNTKLAGIEGISIPRWWIRTMEKAHSWAHGMEFIRLHWPGVVCVLVRIPPQYEKGFSYRRWKISPFTARQNTAGNIQSTWKFQCYFRSLSQLPFYTNMRIHIFLSRRKKTVFFFLARSAYILKCWCNTRWEANTKAMTKNTALNEIKFIDGIYTFYTYTRRNCICLITRQFSYSHSKVKKALMRARRPEREKRERGEQ